MNNLSFNKNSFIKSEPARFSKPIINNPNKLGRRTVEDIKTDMHSLNKPKVEESKPKLEKLQKDKFNNLDSLNAFRQWNRK